MFLFFLPRRVSCHFVTCHFSNDFDVTKKEEVYNILIINNLYINIYFFLPFFGKVTSDNLPITTFNMLIFNILRAQICHFSVLLFPELSLFDCNQKCTNRALGASIVKFAVGVTFAKSDTLESAHFCATKKINFSP